MFSTKQKSIAAGDPWRERIIETRKRATSVLVIASPNSVASSWVNFETGGAWVSGTRVVACCIKGMKPSSLRAPFSHLQALSMQSPEDLQRFVKDLDPPADFNFAEAAMTLISSLGLRDTSA